ncbi:16S rRNA processing protein RimM [Candidatus Rhodobacter oscarellae]|uniref:Ribosome maturation factor RimM n=1 Tax=Candidatus Rhodobacter oscarellae TaxID=1675527 RepID=A0A0J9EFS0_9RHOB|nr:ribosome maturation factor RimM [Candidatus Rhodobacter lobularis]KMW60529.1 16S rRNA processing protein RimM [Candidatus Rhodobacter lobularis]
MAKNKDKVCVGAIAGAFGVSGEVRLKSFCAEPEAVADYGPLSSEDGGRTFTLKITRPIKNGFAARVEGIRKKEAADALRGTRLYADRSALPDLPDDEYYHADLIGLTVLDTGGAELGRVKAVLNHGASDLLEVAVKGQKEPALLPFTMEAVPTVDVKAGRIIADPPEGVFDRADDA